MPNFSMHTRVPGHTASKAAALLGRLTNAPTIVPKSVTPRSRAVSVAYIRLKIVFTPNDVASRAGHRTAGRTRRLVVVGARGGYGVLAKTGPGRADDPGRSVAETCGPAQVRRTTFGGRTGKFPFQRKNGET